MKIIQSESIEGSNKTENDNRLTKGWKNKHNDEDVKHQPPSFPFSTRLSALLQQISITIFEGRRKRFNEIKC